MARVQTSLTSIPQGRCRGFLPGAAPLIAMDTHNRDTVQLLLRLKKDASAKLNPKTISPLLRSNLVVVTSKGWKLTTFGNDILAMALIRNPMPTSPALRNQSRCIGCGKEIIPSRWGRPRSRCTPCKKTHMREYNTRYIRKRRGVINPRPYRRRALTSER